jgi:hypothetical protein
MAYENVPRRFAEFMLSLCGVEFQFIQYEYRNLGNALDTRIVCQKRITPGIYTSRHMKCIRRSQVIAGSQISGRLCNSRSDRQQAKFPVVQQNITVFLYEPGGGITKKCGNRRKAVYPRG